MSSLSLINAGLSSLDGIKSDLHPGLRSINLHSNEVSSLHVPLNFLRDASSTISTVCVSSSDLTPDGTTTRELHTFGRLLDLNLSSNALSSRKGPIQGNPAASISTINILCLAPTLVSLDLSANGLANWSFAVLLPSLSSLKVSYNDLTDLTGVKSFPNLSNLDAKGNKIESSRSLLPLTNCHRVKHLTLQDPNASNPVCNDEGYLSAVLGAAPFLEVLDGRQLDEGFDDDERFSGPNISVPSPIHGPSLSPSGVEMSR